MPPQWGNQQQVKIPHTIPDHSYLKDLEPLGWIHTQPNDISDMQATDLVAHTRMLSMHPNWNGEKCICIVVAFTPGSCSLAAYKLNSQGYEAAKDLQDTSRPDDLYENIRSNISDRVQLLLSDRFMGFYMVPDTGSWNYNFMGVKFSYNMKYGLKLSNPLEFHHELHRPVHFLEICNTEDVAEIEVDKENLFA